MGAAVSRQRRRSNPGGTANAGLGCFVGVCLSEGCSRLLAIDDQVALSVIRAILYATSQMSRMVKRYILIISM